MKVIILSDSHGNFAALKKVVVHESPFDLLVHLGDGLEDVMRLRRVLDFSFDGVNGNNDPRGMYPDSLTLKLGTKTWFICHGHHYGVNRGLEELIKAAQENKAKVAFFGHTHQPFRERIKHIELINPGSVCFYHSHQPTYITWDSRNDDFVFRNL